jgi:hypothetical protein
VFVSASSAEERLNALLGDKDPEFVVIRRDLYQRLKPQIEKVSREMAIEQRGQGS